MTGGSKVPTGRFEPRPGHRPPRGPLQVPHALAQKRRAHRPFGHAGSYTTLEDVVRHHLDPVATLDAYRVPTGLLTPIDRALELTPVALSDNEVAQLVAFLGALTDETSRDLRHEVPATVPSG